MTYLKIWRVFLIINIRTLSGKLSRYPVQPRRIPFPHVIMVLFSDARVVRRYLGGWVVEARVALRRRAAGPGRRREVPAVRSSSSESVRARSRAGVRWSKSGRGNRSGMMGAPTFGEGRGMASEVGSEVGSEVDSEVATLVGSEDSVE